jgi:hypothetical protein
MSVDVYPITLADTIAMSMLCQNSLTDHQVRFAQTVLRCLDPEWSLDCCETCEADLFLDLSSVRPDGRCISFILHARDGAIQVFRLVDDDDTSLGSFDTMKQAIGAVVEAIAMGPG